MKEVARLERIADCHPFVAESCRLRYNEGVLVCFNQFKSYLIRSYII